jgi:hypothetical protein
MLCTVILYLQLFAGKRSFVYVMYSHIIFTIVYAQYSLARGQGRDRSPHIFKYITVQSCSQLPQEQQPLIFKDNLSA